MARHHSSDRPLHRAVIYLHPADYAELIRLAERNDTNVAHIINKALGRLHNGGWPIRPFRNTRRRGTLVNLDTLDLDHEPTDETPNV